MLTGHAVRLTSLTEHDVQQMLRWRNSIELKRLTGSGPFIPATAAEIAIASTSTHIQFAIRPRETDGLLGYIALSNIVWTNRTAELGVFIGDANHRGKRLGSDAVSVLLDYAFNELNLHRVQLDVVDYNEQAMRAYRRLGFTQEGARREHGERDGKRYDVLLFGILAREWHARQDADRA